MDRLASLSPRIRQVIFAGLAVLLAALAWWVLRAHTAQEAQPSASEAARSPKTAAGVVPQPSSAAEPSIDPTTGMPLPLTSEQIQEAAKVAGTFAVRYGSYRYDHDEATWVASLRELLSSRAAVDVTRLAPSGAAKEQLVADKQVTTATVTDTRIGLMSKTSILFEVTVEREITTASRQTRRSDVYEIAVVRDSKGWGVADIRLAGGGMPDVD